MRNTLFYTPSWLILKLGWSLFTLNHPWKAPRKEQDYECYNLTEWVWFIENKMLPGDRKITKVFINGFFWIIVCLTIFLFLI